MKTLVAGFLSVALIGLAVGQEAPKPAEPKGPGPKAEPKKDDPKADEEVDVQKAVERIAENAEKASGRLKEKDPGADTRKIQQDILKDIDALLKKAQQPPPPPMSSDMPPMPMPPPPKSDMMPPPMGGMPPPKGGMPPPMGGMGGMPQTPMPMGGMDNQPMPMPKAGNSGGGSSGSDPKGRRGKRERQPRGDGPKGMNEPQAGGPMGKEPRPAKLEPKEGPTGGNEDKPSGDGQADKFGKASPKRENDKLADLYKDVWGHLPDRMRQEMDLYYREQFMPRYGELLRRYYAALAEQKRKGAEDK